MTERRAVIKSADMAEEMQQDAIDVATQVFQITINQLRAFSYIESIFLEQLTFELTFLGYGKI